MQDESIIEKTINCIRILSLDCVEEAKSGHPGLPLGAAEILYTLWHNHLKFNPEVPNWLDRDRFILSAGHGSAGLYSLLCLYSFLSIEDLKKFRQLESKTPGHPEYNINSAVETTTGPLGQGLATAVGIALAAKIFKEKIESITKEAENLLSHKIYVLASDGDLMEGISYEACSLAGHLKLDNLIVIYDSNDVTIDGPTSITFTEDVEARFKAFDWYVLKVDGHNINEIDKAISTAKVLDKPVLIIAKTKIAKCSPNFEGSNKAHGAPLGEKESICIKEKLKWPKEKFFIPPEVKQYVSYRINELKLIYEKWNKKFENLRIKYPKLDKLYQEFISQPTISIEEITNEIKFDKEKIATRVASGIVLQVIAKKVEKLIGGSADLAHSTNVELKDYGYIEKNNYKARNIHYGVREHAMAAISNGLALYGFKPFCSTFLVFSDYMKPSIRLSALMSLGVVFVFTHDSIFVGEDGPTHQPVEHLWSLRSIPGLYVVRPADAYEVLYSWYFAIKNTKPTALILTRQELPVIDRRYYNSAEGVLKGGYIISKEQNLKELNIVIIATGSEVYLALEVQKLLQKDGLSVRVVSMPCIELFEEQPKEYKQQVLPNNVNFVAIEAATDTGWYKYIGKEGLAISVNHFGKSAPYKDLQQYYGFTPEIIYDKIKKHFNL